MSTHNIPFLNIKKKIIFYYFKSELWNLFQGTQERIEPAVVNEPSVFEPLKFYCICVVADCLKRTYSICIYISTVGDIVRK